ncbi:hypothetical protein [Paenibacillus sp. FSL R5-0470]|uniref:hypothetical protein n=1 Tax=Paenibacillus sp. FSL R5-0470 TaxID=2921641 RepID=UPI0030DBFEC7
MQSSRAEMPYIYPKEPKKQERGVEIPYIYPNDAPNRLEVDGASEVDELLWSEVDEVAV